MLHDFVVWMHGRRQRHFKTLTWAIFLNKKRKNETRNEFRSRWFPSSINFLFESRFEIESRFEMEWRRNSSCLVIFESRFLLESRFEIESRRNSSGLVRTRSSFIVSRTIYGVSYNFIVSWKLSSSLIPFHRVSYNFIETRSIFFVTRWITIRFPESVSDPIVLYCIVLYRIVSYRIVSYRIVLYRIVSYRIVSYRIVSYCIVLYSIVCRR